MTTVRIMVVDDHPIVRRGIRAVLALNENYLVVAEADDGDTGLEQLEKIEVDLILLDLYMPRLNGIDMIPRITKNFPKAKVIVFSMYDDEQFIVRALRDGARGYVVKEGIERELLRAIPAVLRGEIYTSRPVEPSRLSSHKRAQQVLSSREREVLQLIVQGLTTSQIARSLFISPHTATRHRANLMEKLNVHSQMELVRVAVEHGLALFSRAPFPESKPHKRP